MSKYIRKKFRGLFIVMFMASILTFGLMQISSGDPATMYLTSKGTVPTQELLEKTRIEMGLDQPIVVQYVQWLTHALQGDLGMSYYFKVPVADIMGQRIMMTLRLASLAFLFLIVFSIVFGVLSAYKKDTLIDYLVRALSLVKISIPNFWLGLILIYVFIVKHHLFKLTETDSLKSTILPALTLAIPLIGRYTRLIRAAVLEQSKSDYVTGAIARGIKKKKIWLSYILPNAMKHLITLFGLSVAALLGGTVIIENTFAWPGIGSLAMDAITYRDYPLLQGYVLLMALIYVVINFCAEFLTHSLDPRLRGSRKAYEDK
jgi:peptide/nickel transport system permease protein